MTKKNNSLDLSLFVLIATIGKPRGLKGEIFVNPYSDDLINFLSYRDFYYLHEKGLVGIQFEYLKAYKNKIIAKIKNIDDINSADIYKNKDLYLPKSKLPKLDDNGVYWHELIGMEVINLDQTHLGVIERISNYGSNDIIEVKSGTQILLIPFIRNRTIFKIDRSNKTIQVDWYHSYS
tara:strand:- start:821 stop:1354 length:534 start_codon:yes stop_codon:yes gene_type:complete